MKLHDFGDVLEIGNFFQVEKVSCLEQELNFASTFLSYIKGHLWSAPTLFT
jgi:hypothetical protein